jgi:putative endopeptidase
MRPISLLLCAAVSAALALPAVAAEHGLSLADMDTTVDPCQDFYRYANGGWLDRTQLPAAYSRYGGFEELSDRNIANVHMLLDDAVARAKSPGADANTILLARFYGTCMDSTEADALRDKPIQPELARIAAIKSAEAIGPELASLHSQGTGALFFMAGFADPGNSDMTIATLNQSGLGLPDRDYYLKTDSTSVRTRMQYVEHMGRMLQLAGVAPAEAERQANAILALETALASASMSRVAMRNPLATYHKMTLAEVEKLCPSLDWKGYLKSSGVPGVKEVNVRTVGFFTGVDSLLRAVPLADWKAYLSWNVISDAAPLLSSDFVAESFRFQQVLTGAKEQQPRWRRCLQATDRSLGQPLGHQYVDKYFTADTKARALAMVNNLKAALRDRIDQLAWMSDTTKAQAVRKLDAMGLKIGYPDKWRDYSKLELAPHGFVDNATRSSRFERAYRLAKIGKPVDRTEFSMTTPTVNARYSPTLNDILFPAGILQPPFFDPEADDAVNYGGIGVVIGHEMTHGFDDSGRQYDQSGNLRDWWTAADASRYKQRADRIIAQYDAYTVLDSVHVNGKLTTGENISDLGGLTISFAALQKALAKKNPGLIDGFTPEQRFFLGYARIWRQLIRPEEQRRRIATDPHSPGVWRTNGPLSNMPAFYDAFGCKPGTPMVRDEDLRTAIW